MSFRRAAKVDDNQAEIVEALRKAGYSVKPVHTVKGFVDVVAGKSGKNYLIEIKDGSKPPSARKLTEGEQRFHDEWKGETHIIEKKEDIKSLDNY